MLYSKFMKKLLLYPSMLLLLNVSTNAQVVVKGTLNWNFDDQNQSGKIQSIWFKGATNSTSFSSLPIWTYNQELPDRTIASSSRLQVIKEKEINPVLISQELKSVLQDHYDISLLNGEARHKNFANIRVTPLRTAGGKVMALQSMDILIENAPSILASNPGPDFKRNSELKEGQIYKISVSHRGLFRLDKNFFENKLKVNVAGIDPRNIRLLGNGGAMLPESNSALRIDDLGENPVLFKGEDDGIFNDGDYMLFYADGPDSVNYDPVTKEMKSVKNIYSSKSYYFIKFDVKPGKRISKTGTILQTTYATSSGVDYYHHEKDLSNLLDIDECNHGSGQKWYGEELSNTRELNLSQEVQLDNIDKSFPAVVSAEFASRATQTTQLIINIDNTSKSMPLASSPFSCTSRFAANNFFRQNFAITSERPSVNISFPQTGINSDGWLDYINITFTKSLQYTNIPLFIFDPAATSSATTRYNIQLSSNLSDIICWRVTDILNINEIPVQKSVLSASFADESTSYQRYILFQPDGITESPEYESAVENQNIHELDNVDLVIVYHTSLKREAERLLKHRTNFSGLTGVAVDMAQIANEFASGSKDPSALRDFARMLYSRNTKFKYLLLFGSASFDYRHLLNNTKDYDFVPSYQTAESLDPILAYPSDDFFGLLDPQEGENLSGMLDIEIGRLLARDLEEAGTIVDKIIRYDTDPKVESDWKLNMLFLGDDEDGNTHMSGVDDLANYNSTDAPWLNQHKVYLDAYEQISTPGGERYPDVNRAITEEVYRGAFVMTYLGHGGPTGLAQERVLQENDIKTWDNQYKSPLLITATCSFTPFDDPRILSAGELTQDQTNGTIALFSTVRAVYASENYALSLATLEKLFKKDANGYPTLGDILISAKNEVLGANSRKYFLFGDPSQKLAYPKFEAEVTSLNGAPLNTTDTIRALEKVTLKGIVKNATGIVHSDFNGLIFVTVYDKPVNLKTRGNNGGVQFSYQLQKNILFKGVSDVTKGEWSIEFYVPKDINYTVGKGKISLYATNLKDEDAAGYSDKFYVGGYSKNGITDDKPPVVKLYMNDVHFVNGGITNENPKIYAELSDDFGINITGNSIGHDLVAVLDQNEQNPLLLNSFFNAKANDYSEGTVSFPLKSLTPGKHHLHLSAWDISNNQGSADIEFQVLSSDDVFIEKVFNYPNPFNTRTRFQFETNYINLPLDITIQIQSISGKVVKTIQQRITPGGFRIDDIEWDGRDDLGNLLANGVYLYRVGLYSSTKEIILSQKSTYQKLVILR